MQSPVSQLTPNLLIYTWQALPSIDYSVIAFGCRKCEEFPFRFRFNQTQKISSIFSVVKKDRIKYISPSKWFSKGVYLASYVNVGVFSLNRCWQLMCLVLFLSTNYSDGLIQAHHVMNHDHPLHHKTFSGSEIWEMKLAIC